MSIALNEETKEVTQKIYDRCYAINIRSIIDKDKHYSETINQLYERVLEIDGVVIKKEPSFEKMYDINVLLGIKWVAPWGKEISGLDVMAFIKWFNDNYEAALLQLPQPPDAPV